jgi:hypothetical protein
MFMKNWVKLAAAGVAVIVAGAIVFPWTRVQAKSTSATTTTLSAQARSASATDHHRGTLIAQAGQGMGNPGMMNPGMGGPGMMNPGMGGPGMMNPGMGGPGMGMGMPGMGRMGEPPVMVATADYVYVLRGNTLYQFSAKDLTQLHKVTLADENTPMRMRPQMAPQDNGGDNPQ